MKLAKHRIIYNVLSAHHSLWIALGTAFEGLWEVKSNVRAIKLASKRGFRNLFWIRQFFEDVRNEITTFACLGKAKGFFFQVSETLLYAKVD